MFVIDAIPRTGSDANGLSSKDTGLPTEITLPDHLARYAGRPTGITNSLVLEFSSPGHPPKLPLQGRFGAPQIPCQRLHPHRWKASPAPTSPGRDTRTRRW